MTRRTYKNPPIEEALCEIQFASNREWDMAVPFQFREKIKHLYPGKPREQNLLRAGVQTQPGIAPSLMVEQGISKIQFPTEDGKQIVAVGKDLLSIHMLRPYLGWENFEPRISEVFDEYIKMVQPSGITRIGLRYINRIEIKTDESIDLSKYFIAPPSGPAGFSGKLVNFIDRHEYLYTDNPISIVLTFGSAEAPKNALAFLLDIDLIWRWPEGPLPIKDVMKKIGDMRSRERTFFESLITESTREVFDAT